MTRERWTPYAVVLTIGLLFAGGVFVGADRQPGIWVMPPLVLTGVLLTVFALSDRRGENRAAADLAERLGLRELGPHPLPPLTPRLTKTAPAHLLAGVLEDGAPVRVALVHAGRSDLAIAATEILDPARIAADPHDVLGAETTADEHVVTWVREHALPLGLVAEGGTLVVAAVVPHGSEPPFAHLFDAAREARGLLA